MVEGAIKHVIGHRFDHGGMRWIRERAEALLQLRCIEINGDWDHFIQWVHDRRRADVRPSNNQPHNGETVDAARELIEEGCAILLFILPDPGVAAELERIGCGAIRVMAAPVASGGGLVERRSIRKVIDAVDIPVIVEGGLGAPSQVADAMQMGADALLVNTAVAQAPDPARMAAAMRHAVVAGWLTFPEGSTSAIGAAG